MACDWLIVNLAMVRSNISNSHPDLLMIRLATEKFSYPLELNFHKERRPVKKCVNNELV